MFDFPPWRCTKPIKNRRHPLMKVSSFRISSSDPTYSTHGPATLDICNSRTTRIPYRNEARPVITDFATQIEITRTKTEMELAACMHRPNHCHKLRAIRLALEGRRYSTLPFEFSAESMGGDEGWGISGADRVLVCASTRWSTESIINDDLEVFGKKKGFAALCFLSIGQLISCSNDIK